MKVLVIDIGGTHVKLLVTGRTTPVKLPSGPTLTPKKMLAAARKATSDWQYDAVSIGYPGPVVANRPAAEPHNLGRGWEGFDFRKALHRPVHVINDAAMQALGSYRGGRMLFLGLGTGLGTTLIFENVIAPMELAHLPYRHGRTYEEYVGAAGLKRLGRKKWEHHVAEVIGLLANGLQVDGVVLGGGNASKLKKTPPGVRLGDNKNAFVGGFRLWQPLGFRYTHASRRRQKWLEALKRS